jgi:hypothetical protein
MVLSAAVAKPVSNYWHINVFGKAFYINLRLLKKWFKN